LGLLCFLTIGPFPLSFPLKIDGISVVLAVLGGLIARELGGKRQAILVAAVAASIAGPVVFSGSFLSYTTFDLLCWVVVAWCTACLLRSQGPRWWLAMVSAAKSNTAPSATFCLENGTRGQLILGMPKL
jgi:hypothetical protein